MSHFKKAVCMGLLVGLLGAILLPLTFGMEENYGLDALFRFRGSRPVPPVVTVVALDRNSADRLGLSPDPAKWPRSLHARLIDTLVRQGAAVIAFDVVFEDPGSPSEDAALAAAIRRAGNVILGQGLTAFTLPLNNGKVPAPGVAKVERLLSPVPPLDSSALALAPFPLPKIPVKVSQYWQVKPEAGDVASLPVVAFQIWALPFWQDLLNLMQTAGFVNIDELPDSPEAVRAAGDIQGLIQSLRQVFATNRDKVSKIRTLVRSSEAFGRPNREKEVLESLVDFYAGESSSYLNFYGPPAAIPTVCYCDLVEGQGQRTTASVLPDFSGQTVFVGLSERLRLDQKDGFHTVFSLPSGIDISGVEIAATAFANLVEDLPLRPLNPGLHFAFILLWGTMTGFICRMLSPVISISIVVAAAAVYTTVAYQQFKLNAAWYPLVLPLLIQIPLGYIGSLFWQYLDSKREGRDFRHAARKYLKAAVVERFSEPKADPLIEGQTAYGICLFSDAAQYTSLSEQVSPDELNNIMKDYWEVLCMPVDRHGGEIMGLIGDAMLAMWKSQDPAAAQRSEACRAALEIAREVQRFNRRSKLSPLPTRIGLHAGWVVIGTIGAGDHYEYAPMGDAVNTASRIEGLNKYLGTGILVSKEALHQIGGFLTRDLGDFILVGKTQPVAICELIDTSGNGGADLQEALAIFSRALAAFRQRRWREAVGLFQEVHRHCPDDGPSVFYERLCQRFIDNPPDDKWDGAVRMERK